MSSAEKNIDSIMTKWYNGDEKLKSDWYSRPWIWTDRQHLNGVYYSPGELIEAGEAEEVLRLVRFLIS